MSEYFHFLFYTMKYELPPLPYAYDALEPFIDRETMEIHHTKHHQTYIDKLNPVVEKYEVLQNKSLEEAMAEIESLGLQATDRQMLINHGGGHINHSFFWEVMGPKKNPDQKLIADINAEFGSVDAFKKLFNETATKLFGSGWAWLVRDASGKLHVYPTANQDSPHLKGHTPIIALDVWEHAYYLKYRNRRADYIENWWNVVTLL